MSARTSPGVIADSLGWAPSYAIGRAPGCSTLAALSTELSASPTFASICFVRLTWSSASFCVYVWLHAARMNSSTLWGSIARTTLSDSVGQQESHVARRGGVGGEAAHHGAPTRLRGTDRTLSPGCRRAQDRRPGGAPEEVWLFLAADKTHSIHTLRSLPPCLCSCSCAGSRSTKLRAHILCSNGAL
jgi:hypothetical protein